MSMRWNDYVMVHDDSDSGSVESLWKEGLPDNGTVLYLLGEGFDPRSLVGLTRFLDMVEQAPRKVLTIGLAPHDSDNRVPDAAHGDSFRLAQANREQLANLLANAGISPECIPYPIVKEPNSSGRLIGQQLIRSGHLDKVGQVIVDVSALPTSVHFPLIGALLEYQRVSQFHAEIQVVVCENPQLDDVILNEGTGPSGPILGFRNGLDLEHRTANIVWAPVLGKGESIAIRSLYDYLKPDEICPVLPFPAAQPRRADDLVLEYRILLFGEMAAEPGNFIYAHETNPFDLYRALVHLDRHYGEALEPLGSTKVVLSTHSSKLLSLGVLLAAYEKELPVVSAASMGYALKGGVDLNAITKHNRLTCLWLAGSPYQ